MCELIRHIKDEGDKEGNELTLIASPVVLAASSHLLTQPLDGVFGSSHTQHTLRLVVTIFGIMMLVIRVIRLQRLKLGSPRSR